MVGNAPDLRELLTWMRWIRSMRRTGTPEIGGLTTFDAQKMLRCLRGPERDRRRCG